MADTEEKESTTSPTAARVDNRLPGWEKLDGFRSVYAHVGPAVESFEHLGWKFAVCKAPMCSVNKKLFDGVLPHSSANNCDASSPQDVYPEAFFGNNYLTIEPPPHINLTLSFTAADSLNGSKINEWSNFSAPRGKFLPAVPEVSAASTWKDKVSKLSKNVSIQGVKVSFDWTFASKYWGTVERRTKSRNAGTEQSVELCAPSAREQVVGEQTSDAMSTDLLADQSIPILWYQQVDLFDDDLSDSGMSRCDIKIRVMPTFFYVLMRQDIRVDRVLLRQVDTRIFHQFGTSNIFREFQWKEATFNSMEAMGYSMEGGGAHVNSDKIGTQLLNEKNVLWNVKTRIALDDAAE